MTARTCLPLRGVDHVEFYVGNARQAAVYYQTRFGFDVVGYRGPETGIRDRASYLLRQGHIHFVLTTSLDPESAITRHVARHGDGVRDIALTVDDARAVFEEAVRRGAPVASEPSSQTAGGVTFVTAAVGTYGETVHTFVERQGEAGPFLPAFEPMSIKGGGVGVVAIDHLVGNVEDQRMDHWVDYYDRVFGFDRFVSFDDKDISTEYSALRSVVVTNDTKKVKFPINEPAPGRKRSQIQEYIDSYGGPGVQHIALLTGDALGTVAELRRRGVEFLTVPGSYYDEVADRVGRIDEDYARVREQGLLVDRDEDGYLLQLFTKPVEDRPTLFYEIIQRHGAQSFGKGNFKALFEAIEREQARRGNL